MGLCKHRDWSRISVRTDWSGFLQEQVEVGLKIKIKKKSKTPICTKIVQLLIIPCVYEVCTCACNYNYWRIRAEVGVKVIVGVLVGMHLHWKPFMSTDARVIPCINKWDSRASHRCVIVWMWQQLLMLDGYYTQGIFTRYLWLYSALKRLLPFLEQYVCSS